MILGITGPIASGKDAVANYLAKAYGFKKISTHKILEKEVKERGLEVTRENLRKVQAELRKKYGEDYLAKKILEKIKKKENFNYVVVSLRTPTDARVLKEKAKAKVILIDANPFVRYKRQKKRHRKGYSKTYQEFLHEDAIEKAMFDFHITKRYADYKIENNGSLEELKKAIDKLAKKLGLKKIKKKTKKL